MADGDQTNVLRVKVHILDGGFMHINTLVKLEVPLGQGVGMRRAVCLAMAVLDVMTVAVQRRPHRCSQAWQRMRVGVWMRYRAAIFEHPHQLWVVVHLG